MKLARAIVVNSSVGRMLMLAYNNKTGWKLDDNGAIVMQDGNPVFIDENGGEVTLGTDTIKRLNGEAKQLRLRAEEAEKKLLPFDGLDAEAAKKALEIAKNIKDGDLIKAGEAQRVRDEITKQFEAKIADKEKAIGDRDTRINSLVRSNAFGNSQFVKDNIAVPVDMLMAVFANNFREENGKLVGVGADGNVLVSKKKAGEYADFDEALSIMVDGYASKDAILKGGNNRGSGNNGNGSPGGVRTIRRADFEAMDAGEKTKALGNINKGEAQLVD